MEFTKAQILFLYIIIFCIISCKQNSNNKKHLLKDSINSIRRDSTFIYGTKEEFLKLFNKLGLYEINFISFKKAYDSSNQYFNNYAKQCRNWRLDTIKFKKIFQNISPIDGAEWNNYYNYAPCEYDGLLRVNNKMFKFIVEAGSVVHIILPDTTFTFGYKKNGKSLFINTPSYESMK